MTVNNDSKYNLLLYIVISVFIIIIMSNFYIRIVISVIIIIIVSNFYSYCYQCYYYYYPKLTKTYTYKVIVKSRRTQFYVL